MSCCGMYVHSPNTPAPHAMPHGREVRTPDLRGGNGVCWQGIRRERTEIVGVGEDAKPSAARARELIDKGRTLCERKTGRVVKRGKKGEIAQ